MRQTLLAIGTWIVLGFISLVVGFVFIAMFSGCTAAPKEVSAIVTATSTSTSTSTDYQASWPQKEYTEILVKSLDNHGQALMQSYPPEVCGDRKKYYVALMSALAGFESSFDTNAKYTENFKDNKGKYIVSRGLFQMSLESCNGNYACAFKSDSEIHDPKLAIVCAVKAANKLVNRDGVLYSESAPWKGLSAYWAPFRNKAKREAMIAKAKATCK